MSFSSDTNPSAMTVLEIRECTVADSTDGVHSRGAFRPAATSRISAVHLKRRTISKRV
jgi:hypothetical protein